MVYFFEFFFLILLSLQELVFPKASQGSGTLYLDRVLIRHAGRLTCVAVSEAGSSLHTATLQVCLKNN